MPRTAPSLREARHIDKIFFLGTDPRFYEQNYVHYRPADELMSLVEPMARADSAEWEIKRVDVWTHVIPLARKLVKQGWKIHVSANVANCRDLLVKVAALAFAHGVQFKFANDIETLRLMTSKRWTRGGSGKFITLYPGSDEKFHEFIELAYQILKDEAGSYILSDRRYKTCRCLYYRYGSFIAVNRMGYMGNQQQILTSPDGVTIVDRRNPYFESPPWVNDPFPVDESDEGEMTLHDGRYLVKSALGFSNTGGVYLATDTTTGKDVVIKEARPHVELGLDGWDATTRLAQEAKMLRLLDGLGIAPQVFESFWDWENFYLVEEYFDAFDMREVMVTDSPLMRARPTLADSETFYRTYIDMFSSVLDAIDQIHQKGVVIGDLSPMNILVEKSTMTVRIIDLEGAFQAGVESPQNIHTPGFRTVRKGRKKESNLEDDLYAIGAIMMYSMFPIAAMAFVRDDLFTSVLPLMVADMGWADTPVLNVIRLLSSEAISCRDARALLAGPATITAPMARTPAPTTPAALLATCSAMARFVTANYRLELPYTLFPIDPFGSQGNAAGFGFGATGVVTTLTACGFTVPPAALARYQREIAALTPVQLAPGFLVGAAGMAWAMLEAGDHENGVRLLDYANASPLLHAHHSLYYGMAGIGMANLAAWRLLDEQRYLDVALALADKLAATAIHDERGVHWHDDAGIRIGYGYGQSGVALFFLRLSQLLNLPSWRELGRKALAYDLSFAHALEEGVATFPCAPEEENTFEPYIEQGSAGIAKVAIRYGLWDQLDAILADVHRKYSGFPGLIYGLAGFVDVLLDAHLYSRDEKYLAMADLPLQGLTELYLFETPEGLALPGENMFRISFDYATGMVGVISTLHRRAHLLGDALCLDEIDGLPVRARAPGSAAR
jgi:tRNA A-37 threonylcarbamoyl transferase component Bud32